MEPINYSALQVNVNPLQDIFQGLQAKNILTQLKQQSDMQQMQEQYKTDMGDYFNNPTADKLLQMQVKYPSQAEAFKPLLAQMDKNQLIAEQSAGTQAISAIKSGDMDTANKVLDQAIQNGKQSGIDTTVFEQVKNNLGTDPKGALAQSQLILFHSMTPEQQDKWANAQKTLEETLQSRELFPEKQAQEAIKTQTEGYKAAQEQVKADYAKPNAVADLEKKGWDVKNIQSEIWYRKASNQIAAMNAAIAKEGNGLKRQELQLKLADLKNQFNDKANAKIADAQSAFTTSDNILNSIDRILAVPKNVRESAHGPINSRLPTVSSNTADYEALLDTLGSQAFLSQVSSMKGMGALSDAEGKKLTAGLQNLSLTQSADQAERNIREMKKIMLKARKNMEIKTGVKAPLPESTYKSNADTKAIFEKYGIQ